MEDALILDGVEKSFGKVTAVDHISAAIPQGCIYGFLGPNGAGKTTTIRMIMNIFHPDAGNIRILGQDHRSAIKDKMGYLPEEKGLYKKMKAGEMIAYFGRLKGMKAANAKTRAEHLLEQFGLGEWIHKKCDTLSKGMGQKVQLLSTLVHEPDLVILDEPFSGLDPVNVEVVREAILEIRKSGRTVILSTHMMEQAEQICDGILLIDRGKKVLDGPLAQVKKAAGQSVLIDYEGDGQCFHHLPGITKVSDAGQRVELLLDKDGDAQHILTQLVDKIRIRRFELTERSLHEIFIEAVNFPKGAGSQPPIRR